MTIRVIVRTDDAGMAANIGGDVHTTFRTFDIEAAELEAFLTSNRGNAYTERHVIGVELLIADPQAALVMPAGQERKDG